MNFRLIKYLTEIALLRYKLDFFEKSIKAVMVFAMLIFHTGILCAQKVLPAKEIDSIYSLLNNREYYNREGISKLTDLYYKSKEINYVNGQINILRRLADLEISESEYAQSYNHIQELKKLSLSVGDYTNYINASCSEAKILYVDKNYDQAKKVLRNSKKYLPQIKDEELRRKSKIDIDLFLWCTIKYSEMPKNSYKDSLLRISETMCKDALLLKTPKYRSNRIMFCSQLFCRNFD